MEWNGMDAKSVKIIAAAFVTLMAMACMTVTVCSSEDTWMGNTSYDGDVRFCVSGDKIISFSISAKKVPVALIDKPTGIKIGSGISNIKVDCNVFNTPIVNSKFNYTSSTSMEENSVSGTFTSLSEAEGTWKHESEDLWQVIRVYPLITWNATRVYTSSTPATTIIEISPSAKTVNSGATFTVDINVTSNQPVKEVRVDLCFEPSLLTVDVNRITKGEMFTNFEALSCVAGTVTISGFDGGTSTGSLATVSMTASSTNTGTTALVLSNVTIRGSGNEKLLSNAKTGSVTIRHAPAPVFDTGYGTYPSIFGTHKGTIEPKQTITVQKLYTYPCAGTGGHSESVRLWNDSWSVTASWDGYEGSDWQNISFSHPFTLHANHTYYYSISTGSYPQIIHKQTLPNEYGTINCTSFVDADGRSYNNWIPAIRFDG